jgi:hypothetical protein
MRNKNGFGILAIVLTVMIVLVIAGGLVWMFYGKTIGAMIAIRSLDNNYDSLLNTTPTTRILSPIAAPIASTTLQYGGYIFTVPWQGISSTKGGASPTSSVSIVFADGNRFSVLSGVAATDEQEKDINDIDSLDPSYQLHTLYDLNNASYNATPGQVTITTPGNDSILIALLLTLKAVTLIPAGTLYRFDTGTINGFQHGDPVPGKEVDIECYDHAGKKFSLIVTGTQPEIDYILASIKPQG